MSNYWSLKFLKSLSFKLCHLCMHRVLELIDSGITEKVCGDGVKWLIPTYTLTGCISQRRCCLYYTFKTVLKMQKSIEYWKKHIEKRYWKFCISKSYIEIWHFTVKFDQFSGNFSRNFIIIVKPYFYRLDSSENKFCY